MKLLLVRHGDAVAGTPDAERPLSDKGRRDVQRLTAFLARSGVRVARVIHSGRVRARDTALLMAEVLGPGAVVEEAVAGLDPGDATDLLHEAVADWIEDTVVVGHQPFMGHMAARLLTGGDGPAGVGFEAGAAACLERDQGHAWTLRWLVGPTLLGQ